MDKVLITFPQAGGEKSIAIGIKQNINANFLLNSKS